MAAVAVVGRLAAAPALALGGNTRGGPLRGRCRRSSTRPPRPGSTTYDGGPTFSVGGGVAVFDCNDDGKPEMYLAGGSNLAALYRNDSAVGGALRFTPLHDPATDLADVNGAYPLDIDGDGKVDLAVLRVGGNVLLRGLGDCRFERANETWGYDGRKAWTTAFSAAWESSATLPTLALGNYLRLDADGESTFDCDDNVLLRADATGTRYGPPTALVPGYCTLSILFSDWDRSGRRDLRMTNDRHYYSDGAGAALAGRRRARRRGSTPPLTAGSRCRSGAWASPATTSPATATRTCS